MTAGLAAPPPDLTAQTGSGEQGRSLRAWVGEARKGPFHPATGPGTPDIPTVAPAFDVGAANARDVRTKAAQAPDSAVSPGTVFAYTLAGATIPLIPAMGADESVAAVVYLVAGGLATLVTVPIAAVAAGIDSFPRTLAGTVAGFLAGVGLANIHPPGAIPVFCVTMASVTTLITAM